jgi:O-antigen ligase
MSEARLWRAEAGPARLPETAADWSLPQGLAQVLLASLQALLALPLPLFLLTLTAMLFRPPDVDLPPFDRFAFALLALATGLRALLLRQAVYLPSSLWVPMLGLSALSLLGALQDPFHATTWSVLAARVFVPCAMFVLAQITFADEGCRRWLERFLLVVFAYLSLMAVASLLGAQALIFPRFILDESLGIHADRARGPFLQAVANGVSLNLLGLLALDRIGRRRLRGLWAVLWLAGLPLAIVATKTRAVWISFAASLAWMSGRTGGRCLRLATRVLVGIACTAVFAAFCWGSHRQELSDRLQEEGPVEFRLAAYQAGWEMFLQKPLAGWGTRQVQEQLAEHIRDFRGESFAVHNTYIQILMEQGLLGFGFYAGLMIGLYRLGKVALAGGDDFVSSLRGLWPVLLAVYLVNATFVVMNYQFVNSLLFTLAGMLAGAGKHAAARS